MARIDRNARSEDLVEMSDNARFKRSERVAVGTRKNVLVSSLRDDENWHYCVVNEPNVEEYKQAGYEFVLADGTSLDDLGTTPLESVWRKQVGYDRKVGRPIHGYLMRQPMKYYLEDMAAKRAKSKEIKASLKGEWKSKDGKNNYGDITEDETDTLSL